MHVPGRLEPLFDRHRRRPLRATRTPLARAASYPRNTGLGSLCTNFLAQHPTEPAVLYVGLQDNGTAKCTGEESGAMCSLPTADTASSTGDDPFHVMLFANGRVFRATDGALDYSSWTSVTPPGATWAVMAEPLVGTPPNPGAPAEADIVAFGSRGHTSTSRRTSARRGPIGRRFRPELGLGLLDDRSPRATRLFVGTTNGRVFRLDDAGAAGWTVTRIDNAAGGRSARAAWITDIAIDWSDATPQLDLHQLWRGRRLPPRLALRRDGLDRPQRHRGERDRTAGRRAQRHPVRRGHQPRLRRRRHRRMGVDRRRTTWAPCRSACRMRQSSICRSTRRLDSCARPARAGHLRVEARRSRAARRGALHPRHDARHRPGC